MSKRVYINYMQESNNMSTAFRVSRVPSKGTRTGAGETQGQSLLDLTGTYLSTKTVFFIPTSIFGIPTMKWTIIEYEF